MREIIINAENATLGRLASYVAKQALLGNKIIILNSEKAIVTGRRLFIINDYLKKRSKGGKAIQKGPYYSRSSEKIVKRAIRGMLPDFRQGNGKEALKRILCFVGIPDKYKNSKMIKAGKEKTTSFILVEEISKEI